MPYSEVGEGYFLSSIEFLVKHVQREGICLIERRLSWDGFFSGEDSMIGEPRSGNNFYSQMREGEAIRDFLGPSSSFGR